MHTYACSHTCSHTSTHTYTCMRTHTHTLIVSVIQESTEIIKVVNSFYNDNIIFCEHMMLFFAKSSVKNPIKVVNPINLKIEYKLNV